MIAFIKVHDSSNGQEILINVNYIISVMPLPIAQPVNTSHTPLNQQVAGISMGGSLIVTTETFERVVAAINTEKTMARVR